MFRGQTFSRSSGIKKHEGYDSDDNRTDLQGFLPRSNVLRERQRVSTLNRLKLFCVLKRNNIFGPFLPLPIKSRKLRSIHRVIFSCISFVSALNERTVTHPTLPVSSNKARVSWSMSMRKKCARANRGDKTTICEKPAPVRSEKFSLCDARPRYAACMSCELYTCG